MKRGREKPVIPHLIVRWRATMVRNSASLLEYTLKNILSKGNIGLYRDNGLFILRKINKQINYERK